MWDDEEREQNVLKMFQSLILAKIKLCAHMPQLNIMNIHRHTLWRIEGNKLNYNKYSLHYLKSIRLSVIIIHLSKSVSCITGRTMNLLVISAQIHN